MKPTPRSWPVPLTAVVLASLTAAACGTTWAGVPSAAHMGFTGYKWTVVAITRDGTETAIPAHYDVYLQFTPNGQFVGNEPVNSHFGTYRRTGDGFTTSELGTTTVGYFGRDPVTLLAIGALSSFDAGSSAAVRNLTADVIAIDVNGYTLTCDRARAQANFPAPAFT